MARVSKRTREAREKIGDGKSYPVMDAIKLLKENATAKFDETVEVAVNLGVDPRKSDQIVRGSTVLPQGTGKVVKVAVFAQGDQADEARAEGAEHIGMQDLADQVQGGMMDFSVVIAAPDAMPVVGKLGKLLGPPRFDAQPEGRYRDRRYRPGGAQRKSGPGSLPDRQERDHPLRDRQDVVCRRGVEGKPGYPAGGPEQGETERVQGCLPEKNQPFNHHGPRSRG